MGSSREALPGRSMPKKMPTRPRSRGRARTTTRAARPGSPREWTTRPMALPQQRCRACRRAGQHRRFEQELPQDFAAARAERLADADLARPLRDRDRHDRHHADAADHQRDRRNDDQRQKDRRGDLIPHRQHGVLGDEVEVVRLVERQAMPDAHDGLDFADRLPRAMPSRGTTTIMPACRRTRPRRSARCRTACGRSPYGTMAKSSWPG